ncbi:Predicted transcriptional regulator YdeE, contains AraC-type DNA-binding domain [Clostridium sp. DSM 8431]|nr:Predicted transcriptional regulator YdeE, contains AraC-type DNA-binding domain [Clostridium sp. DSM 8431]
MDYKIIEKDEFKVVGIGKKFKYDSAFNDIPLFWQEYMSQEKNKFLCGMYGVNIDQDMNGNEFEYMIADDYSEEKAKEKGAVVKNIPKFTWAVFPCYGDCTVSMQETNKKIFSEWLPNNKMSMKFLQDII